MSSSLLRSICRLLIQTLGTLMSRSGNQDSGTPSGVTGESDPTLKRRSSLILTALILMAFICLGMILELMLGRSSIVGLVPFRIGSWSQDMAQEQSRKALEGTSMRSQIGQLNSRIASRTTGTDLESLIPNPTQTIGNDPPVSLQFPSPRRGLGLSALNRWLTNGSNKGSGGGLSLELRRRLCGCRSTSGTRVSPQGEL